MKNNSKFKVQSLILLALAALALSGCAGIIAARDYKDLSPDQVKALKDIGHQVFSCFMVGGPPVGGRTTVMTLPARTQGTVKFTPDCQLQEATLNLSAAPESEKSEEMKKLVAVEQEFGAMVRSLPAIGQYLSADEKRAVKDHSDNYYIYHQAASVDLANGNLERFRSHLDQAKKELQSMTAVVKKVEARGSL